MARKRAPQLPPDLHPSRLWRVTKIALVAVGLLVAALVVIGLILHEPRPEGSTGDDAEALAQRMLMAVDAAAWERTGAIRWGFGGRQEHLWDKSRNYARVRWGGDTEVLLRLHDQSGVARVDGQTVGGPRGAELRERAYAHWVNDAFWLNPVVKLFDEGTSRALVALEGEDREGLLLSYASGGLTPGDAYLWIPGPDGLPTAWKMWVSILPIGGVRCSWEGWITLATGAKVSTRHDCGVFTLELTDVEGAADVVTLEGDDPFAALE
ncbi:MAG: hypothetical protein KF901_13095 [Myxococcales bacterium]|nr:hypothetical protein [Myxococcales bacterium]